jgi:hypothetical protein
MLDTNKEEYMKNNLKWKIISLALFSSLIILALNFHCQIKVKNQEIENLKKEMEYNFSESQ